jgi:VanZ family protein
VNALLQKLRLPLLILLIGYWGLIFTLTHLPPKRLPHVNLWDKAEHLLAYGCLASLLFLTLWSRRPDRRKLALVVLVTCMSYGAIDEWLQIPVGRDCSILDWTADTLGSSLAVGGLSLLRRMVSGASKVE